MFQVHGQGSNQSILKCFYDIYKEEGVAGLWRVIFIVANNKMLNFVLCKYLKLKFMTYLYTYRICRE